MEGEESTVSFLLLGDEDVGKSTFLARLARSDRRPPPGNESVAREVTLSINNRWGKTLNLKLRSSSSLAPEEFEARPDVLVLCYSISSRASLLSTQTRWNDMVKSYYNYDEKSPTMLLGLKRDLRKQWTREQAEMPDELRTEAISVMPPEGHSVAVKMRLDKYAECSAYSGELMDLVWQDLIGMAVTVLKGGLNEDQSSGMECALM